MEAVNTECNIIQRQAKNWPPYTRNLQKFTYPTDREVNSNLVQPAQDKADLILVRRSQVADPFQCIACRCTLHAWSVFTLQIQTSMQSSRDDIPARYKCCRKKAEGREVGYGTPQMGRLHFAIKLGGVHLLAEFCSRAVWGLPLGTAFCFNMSALSPFFPQRVLLLWCVSVCVCLCTVQVISSLFKGNPAIPAAPDKQSSQL